MNNFYHCHHHHHHYSNVHSVMFSGCCKNDKRKHGQKVWFILACSSGRRLWLWAHAWSQKSSLHVFWRDCGSLYLEVLMKRKRHPLMNYSCIYIYNISDIIILWKIYWLLLKIFNIIIIRVDKIFFTIFVLSMEFDVISWLCLVLKNVSLGLGGLIWNHTLYQGKKLHWGFVNFCLLNSLPLMEGHLEILLEFPSNKFFEKCCIWTVDLFMT